MADSLTVEVEQDRARIVLANIMDMSAAPSLLDTLRKCCAEQQEIIIDSKKVERMSTACLQIMLSAAQTLENKGAQFYIENVTPALSVAMNDLGVSNFLNKWSRC